MKKDDISNALKQLRKISKKRKFNQTVDLVINFKELDKKHNVDVHVNLPIDIGKGVKVCAIVDALESKAKDVVDYVVNKEALGKMSVKDISNLGKEYDVFIAEASLMGQVATVLGRTLGPLGKMPNPKTGGVLMPDGDVKAAVGRFKGGLRIRNKNELSVKVIIGKEDFKDEDLIENIHAIYEAIVGHLPGNEGNVKDTLVKLTMSKPVRVGKEIKVEEKDEGKK
jgi:large subunit ribosomal protein L1